MANALIGRRLQALRDKRGLSQEAVARLLGFKDRQIISNIENGERKLSADELMMAVEKLDVSLEYFTDPFSIEGEACFNWRQTQVPGAALENFEHKAGQLIALFRTLRRELGEENPLMRPALRLSARSRYEDATQAGERFTADFKLGDIPAVRLAEVMERDLNILVLMVSPSHKGISGAACRLPELDVVLVNRDEIEGRRNFDLAHELFHILTWEAMTPGHVEDASENGSNSRIEQLANAFASALLMPSRVVSAAADWKKLDEATFIASLNSTAAELHVTASAFLWRLVSLDLVSRAKAKSMAEALRNNGRAPKKGAREMPPLFSKPYLEVVARAIDLGRVSMSKAARVLNAPVDGLSELFEAHGIAAPDEL